MSAMLAAALWGGGAALALVVGAVLTFKYHPKDRTTGLIMGFGAGALLGAVAYDLLPESDWINLIEIAVSFTLGALVFFYGDMLVNQRGASKRKRIHIDENEEQSDTGVAIFLGTLLDGVPESLILGMTLSLGGSVSVAFAAAIIVSNIPEGIAGTSNLEEGGVSRRTIIWMWLGLAVASALAAAIGYFLAEVVPEATGMRLNAFAAGAIITMLANTMMPEAFSNGGKLVGLCTALGFITAGVLAAFE